MKVDALAYPDYNRKLIAEIQNTYQEGRTTFEVRSTFVDVVSLPDIIFRNALHKISHT